MSKLSNIDLATQTDLDHASLIGEAGKPAKPSPYEIGFDDATGNRGYAPPTTPYDVENYILGYFDARMGDR